MSRLLVSVVALLLSASLVSAAGYSTGGMLTASIRQKPQNMIILMSEEMGTTTIDAFESIYSPNHPSQNITTTSAGVDWTTTTIQQTTS